MRLYWGLCKLFSGIITSGIWQIRKMREYEGRFTHTYNAVGRYFGT